MSEYITFFIASVRRVLTSETNFWTFCITGFTRSSFYNSVKFELKKTRISKFMKKIRCYFIIKAKPNPISCMIKKRSQKRCHKANQRYWVTFKKIPKNPKWIRLFLGFFSAKWYLTWIYFQLFWRDKNYTIFLPIMARFETRCGNYDKRCGLQLSKIQTIFHLYIPQR